MQQEQTNRRTAHRQQGSAVLLALCGMVVLIVSAGLALDGGMAYLARARLSNAVDAAALAAGRAAQSSGSDAERRDRARRAGLAYFRGAYAPLPLRPHIEVRTLEPIHIRVSAQVRQPLFLLSLLGYRDLPLRARAEVGNAVIPASMGRNGVDLMMVTDMSTSILSTVNAPTRDWFHVVEESQRFFEKLAPDRDRVAQIVYGDGARLLVPFLPAPRFDLRAMRNANDLMRSSGREDGLSGVVGGGTATGPALRLANEALANIPSRAASQVLLLFTDGVANRVCREVRRPDDARPCRDIGPEWVVGQAVEQMTAGIRSALERGTRVLIIGYGRELSDPAAAVPGADGTVRKTGEQWLREALGDHGNGLFCAADDPASLQHCYDSYARLALLPATTGPVRLIR